MGKQDKFRERKKDSAYKRELKGIEPVSYTHLDVYKRQPQHLQLRAYIPSLYASYIKGMIDQLYSK